MKFSLPLILFAALFWCPLVEGGGDLELGTEEFGEDPTSYLEKMLDCCSYSCGEDQEKLNLSEERLLNTVGIVPPRIPLCYNIGKATFYVPKKIWQFTKNNKLVICLLLMGEAYRQMFQRDMSFALSMEPGAKGCYFCEPILVQFEGHAVPMTVIGGPIVGAFRQFFNIVFLKTQERVNHNALPAVWMPLAWGTFFITFVAIFNFPLLIRQTEEMLHGFDKKFFDAEEIRALSNLSWRDLPTVLTESLLNVAVQYQLGVSCCGRTHRHRLMALDGPSI